MNALGARVRLVKGAYKEPEAVAYQTKSDVDAAFVRMMKLLLTEGTYPAIATHDPAMIDARARFAATHGIAPGSLRVPDAVRHPPRPAGTLVEAGVPRARLRSVRPRMVSVLHAPAGRAACERRVRAPRPARRTRDIRRKWVAEVSLFPA